MIETTKKKMKKKEAPEETQRIDKKDQTPHKTRRKEIPKKKQRKLLKIQRKNRNKKL